MGHSHKPGSLKQSNKKHKGATSKRATKRGFGNGRVEGSAASGPKGKEWKPHKNDAQNARNDRVNRNAQIRKQKNADASVAQKIGSLKGPPKIVGVLSLSFVSSANDCFDEMVKPATWTKTHDQVGLTYAYYEQQKSRCAFMVGQNIEDVQEAVDIARVADLLICVVNVSSSLTDAVTIIDASGDKLVSALKAAGCPETMVVFQGINNIPAKHQAGVKTAVQNEAEKAFGASIKVGDMSKLPLVVRQMCNTSPKSISWRQTRSYLVADSWEAGPAQPDGTASLKLRGYLRGHSLALNSLMHLCGVGTAKIQSVQTGGDAFSGSRGNGGVKAVEMAGADAEFTLVADPEMQDSLKMEAEGDAILGEQTWPTEAEMNEALNQVDEGAGRHRRTAPSVIKSGMSSYQADWYVDEDGVFDAEGAQVDEAGIGQEEERAEIPDQEGDDDMDMAGSMDAPVNGDIISEKQRLRAMADEDAQFPDEMDTPVDKAARDRFARFRALQSFRSSLWHPKENLPHDYSRIFQFENFANVQKRVLGMSALAEETAMRGKGVTDPRYPFAFQVQQPKKQDAAMDEEQEVAGAAQSEGVYLLGDSYVEITLTGVRTERDLSVLPCAVAVGLLEHENKMSVLHFTLKRTGNYTELIKSKEPLLFQTGFRSFEAKPIFSESNLNCDKHRMERFLREDNFSMASVYGPITYMPCPLLVYKKLSNGQLVLVATGSLTKVDPDRIMLKRVVLTGLPIRVRKRLAVIKHLFYNTNDVRWFKPAELTTKHGLRGHIKEPVGTHGLFKCLFSAPITQNDTIMLVLFKRMYPKMVNNQVDVY